MPWGILKTILNLSPWIFLEDFPNLSVESHYKIPTGVIPVKVSGKNIPGGILGLVTE